MNKREKKELIALRAVELFSNMIIIGVDDKEKISQKFLEDLKEAVTAWSPSVAEIQQIRERHSAISNVGETK